MQGRAEQQAGMRPVGPRVRRPLSGGWRGSRQNRAACSQAQERRLRKATRRCASTARLADWLGRRSDTAPVPACGGTGPPDGACAADDDMGTSACDARARVRALAAVQVVEYWYLYECTSSGTSYTRRGGARAYHIRQYTRTRTCSTCTTRSIYCIRYYTYPLVLYLPTCTIYRYYS